MSLGEQPAFPRVVPLNIDREYEAGMTYRQWLAGMAMQGLLSFDGVSWDINATNQLAQRAIMQADALIAKLEKKGQPDGV